MPAAPDAQSSTAARTYIYKSACSQLQCDFKPQTCIARTVRFMMRVSHTVTSMYKFKHKLDRSTIPGYILVASASSLVSKEIS